MNKQPGKTLLINTFGTLGYIFCFLLWGWTGIVYLPMLMENDQVERYLLPAQTEPVIRPPIEAGPSPLIAIVAVGVSIAVVVITIIVLLRAPVTIAKTGKTITSKAAGSALPLITHGKPVAPARKKRLTVQLVKLMKLCLVLLPVVTLALGFYVNLPLPFEIVALASSLLALASIFWFSAQYITARLLNVEPSQLV